MQIILYCSTHYITDSDDEVINEDNLYEEEDDESGNDDNGFLENNIDGQESQVVVQPL